MPTAKRISALAGPAAVVAAVLGLLVLTEWTLRLLVPEPPPLRFVQLAEGLANTDRAEFTQLIEPDPHTFWRMAPNVERPENEGMFRGRLSNSDGLREDRDLPLARGDRELRILLLGASGLFGLYLETDETLVSELEAQLARRFPELEIECINAAVPGYAVFQGWQFLRHRGLAYHPDLVVASFGWNDSVAQYAIGDIELNERRKAARPPVFPNSRFASLVWRLFRPLDVSGSGGQRERATPEEFEQILGWMRDASLEADADFLTFISAAGVNILPDLPATRRTAHQIAQYRFSREQRLRDEATPASFDEVPVVQELAASHAPHELYFDGYHQRAIVNRFVAERLAGFLEPWIDWRLSARDR